MSQLYISSAEIFSAQLRSYPCHPSSTMTELFLNLVQKLSGIDVSFNVSKSHTLIGKSKTVDFSMILMYLNMILLNCEASVFWFLDKLYLFWPKCVAAGIFHWSSWECAQLIFKRVECCWIEVFEPSKRAQILNCSKIFNFIHDCHIFLALLVK